MWETMFQLPIPVLEKVLRPVLVYLFLVGALRLAGKRELAQLTTLDFVVLLVVVNAVKDASVGTDRSLTGGFLAAGVLLVVNAVLAILLVRSARARRILEGKATELITDGVVDEPTLRRAELSHDDLLAALQTHGADHVGQVQRAVIEPNGKFVVELKTPDESELRHREVMARIDELTRLVNAGPGPGPAPAQ
jgi:uncharacterized membrane protein YcaP (DUF421 family)